MLRRSSVLHRFAAAVAILVQLALQSGIAWQDARAEGAIVRHQSHVEQLGTRHAQHAHAADCAVSQLLQTHSAPVARLRAPAVPRIAAVPRPPQPALAPPRWAAAATLSRGPPSGA